MTPQRIQRKRIRGWKMPDNTMYVGRPTKYGNPYRIVKENGIFVVRLDGVYFGCSEMKSAAAIMAVNWFIDYLGNMPTWIRSEMLDELRGNNLACWCPLDQSCHADILIALANVPEASPTPSVTTTE
jgi:hypothetical protein